MGLLSRPRTTRTMNRLKEADSRSKQQQLENIQRQRLLELCAYATRYSPYYARHYRRTPTPRFDLPALPPVTKPELMAHFDDWVTDPAVTRALVEAFVTDPARVGQLYAGRYAVYTTSGTTGTPGLFLHDQEALAVYDRLWQFRGWRKWLGFWRMLYALRQDFREVFVVATGGHFGGAATAERLRQRYPWLAGRLHILSVLLPLPELVQRLNHLQPSVLAIYPTALALLNREQAEGRLHIRPLLIVTSGEWMAPAVREQAAAVFNCAVHDVYACSEFMYVAFDCAEGWLHANADWLILEPVDAGYKPVPWGQPAHTVLLTNLANHIQPLIRYDLGDSVTLKPEPCPCGNPLPALRVEGRQDDTLAFPTTAGETVQVLPMALATVVETTPGIQCYQLIQTRPATLTVRLEVIPDADASLVWETILYRLHGFLLSQGVSGVTIQKSPELPYRDPRSGKFRQVWLEVKHRKRNERENNGQGNQ